MTEQSEFEKWLKTDPLRRAICEGSADRAWKACSKRKDAEIDKLSQVIKDLTLHISNKEDEIEKLCDVAKETITTLEHARVFITSKLISMHPDGIELYDENIEALRKIAYR